MEAPDAKSSSEKELRDAGSKDDAVVATQHQHQQQQPDATELFNRQVDLQKIEFLNSRMLLLQSENDSLRARHEKREQETHEFVSYFQKEIQTRDRQISRLTEELASAKLSHALELEATVAAHEATYQQIHQSYSSKEESFTEQLVFLKEELQQLEMFKDMKETVHVKMKDLESALQREKENGSDAVRDLERKFLEEKARLQKEHEKRIEVVKQQAKEDARNGLDADTRKIVTDNRRMGEELRFQLQMTDELQREKQDFEARSRKYYMETQLAMAKETEYARQAQRQTREIKQLRASLKDVERKMAESLAAVEREKHSEVARNGRELDDLALDADGLRRLLRLKNKELRNLRRLAQTILDQRTDVEQFFLDALEHVKHEIERERKRQRDLELERYHAEMKRAQGVRVGLRFPKLASPKDTDSGSSVATVAVGPPTASRHFSEKIDLRQLTWDERERVLRLVFAKINGAQSYAPDPEQQQAQQQQQQQQQSEFRDDALDETNADELFPSDSDAGVYFATEPASPTLHRGSNSSSYSGARGASVPRASVSMSLTGLPIAPNGPPPHRQSRG